MMLDWIVLSDETTANTNYFIEEFDIEQYEHYRNLFLEMDNKQKKQYRGVDHYIEQEHGLIISDQQNNYRKLKSELNQARKNGLFRVIFPIDMYSEKDTIMDLLASLENEKYIKEICRKKKTQLRSDLQTDQAIKLNATIKQGRNLLVSAQSANMLSKPLINFYAAAAYAYAAIVINSPIHKAMDSLKGSHGHTYNHKNGTIEFGGEIPCGTFIDLMFACYCPQVISEKFQLRFSALPSLFYLQNHVFKISLIALLATVPELNEHCLQLEHSQRRVYPLTIEATVNNNEIKYVFIIGDGKNKPTKASLLKPFSLQNEDEIDEESGKYRITIPSSRIDQILPTIYQGIHGELWYIDPLVNELYIPEICLHYLIISALCNIMRYSPHEWNQILSNDISSEFSLLISKYLRLFERKYPILVAQQLTEYNPIVKN